MVAYEPPGWFGKLSMLGDFAHRRLPTAVVERCDEWLSQCVSQSRQTLGTAWLETYLTAPLWCFVWAPRVIDDGWWIGVLMPSVDSVGRYFPLLVMRDADHAPDNVLGLSQLSTWYDSVGRCTLATLQPHARLEQFEAQLAGVVTPDASGSALPVHAAGGDLQLEVPDATRWLPDAPAIALGAVLAGMTGRSLWWPLIPGATTPQSVRVHRVQGLPSAERFAAMLRGYL